MRCKDLIVLANSTQENGGMPEFRVQILQKLRLTQVRPVVPGYQIITTGTQIRLVKIPFFLLVSF